MPSGSALPVWPAPPGRGQRGAQSSRCPEAGMAMAVFPAASLPLVGTERLPQSMHRGFWVGATRAGRKALDWWRVWLRTGCLDRLNGRALLWERPLLCRSGMGGEFPVRFSGDGRDARNSQGGGGGGRAADGSKMLSLVTGRHVLAKRQPKSGASLSTFGSVWHFFSWKAL